MKKYSTIGLMSGTSLDGLDIAFCEFIFNNKSWQFRIRKGETISYQNSVRDRLIHAENASAEELARMDTWFGEYCGKAVLDFLKRHKLPKPDLIASHGQTLFHQPGRGFTFQAGSGAVIAAKTGITTVCDFRRKDIALGGQGAPLVPIGDELLFPEFDYCLNLGGFANISTRRNGKRIAYDVCPANIVLNHLAGQVGKSYDQNGKLARRGQIIPDLLFELNAIPYYNQKGPKSLGKEWVLKEIFPLLQKNKRPVADLLRTYSEHTAYQVSKSISGRTKKVLVTGGGSYNSYLIDRITIFSQAEIIIPQDSLIQFKEALIFAFLGVLRMREETNTLKSVTGAKKNSCGGCIYSGK